jgi:MFS family permease
MNRLQIFEVVRISFGTSRFDRESMTKETAKLTESTVENDGAFYAEDYIDAPPDGGYGWVCCGCVSVMNMATWGASSSFGVLLSFYLESDQFPGATPTEFALMTGLLMFFTLSTISVSSIFLYKFGYRITVMCGIILQLGAYIGASFATTVVQLIMTQGVLLGIAIGMIFGANSIILPTWFLKRRALAIGISQAGIGVGGITFSLSSNALIHKTGDCKWALKSLGIISFVICTTTMFLVRIRRASTDRFTKDADVTVMNVIKSVMDYKVLKSFPLHLATIWAGMATMGYVICLFSLSNYAISIGLTADQATITTVVFNLSQAFGRPLIGICCEWIGRVNFSLFATFYTSLMVFVWWINVHSYGSLVAFSLFLGVFVAIGSVTWTPLVVDVLGMNSFATASSWLTFWMASGSLVAEIIGLNLRDYSIVSQTPYFHCQIFVGAIYFVAAFFLLPYREWRVNRMLNRQMNTRNATDEEADRYDKIMKRNSICAYFKRALLPVKI